MRSSAAERVRRDGVCGVIAGMVGHALRERPIDDREGPRPRRGDLSGALAAQRRIPRGIPLGACVGIAGLSDQ